MILNIIYPFSHSLWVNTYVFLGSVYQHDFNLIIIRSLIHTHIHYTKINLAKGRHVCTLLHRGSDNSPLLILFKWTLYELCCLHAASGFRPIRQHILNALQYFLRWWKSFCWYLFMSPHFSLLRSKGQLKLPKYLQLHKSHNLIDEHN